MVFAEIKRKAEGKRKDKDRHRFESDATDQEEKHDGGNADDQSKDAGKRGERKGEKQEHGADRAKRSLMKKMHI